MKAFASEIACEAAETCRRSCGGHGFLMTSGIADIVLDLFGSVTYEGENTVLYLQTARCDIFIKLCRDPPWFCSMRKKCSFSV